MTSFGSGSRYKTTAQITESGMTQNRYTDVAKADKIISDVVPIPSKTITDAQTATFVGKGSLCRVKGNGTAYLHFGDDLVTAPTSTSQDAILTPNAFFFVVATDDYVRTDAAIRIEVTVD